MVVTIFCDDNKKYLSSALAGVEPVKPGYRSQVCVANVLLMCC